jgi:hypothetical protein
VDIAPWHFCQVPTGSENVCLTLGDAKAVHGDKHNWPPDLDSFEQPD